MKNIWSLIKWILSILIKPFILIKTLFRYAKVSWNLFIMDYTAHAPSWMPSKLSILIGWMVGYNCYDYTIDGVPNPSGLLKKMSPNWEEPNTINRHLFIHRRNLLAISIAVIAAAIVGLNPIDVINASFNLGDIDKAINPAEWKMSILYSAFVGMELYSFRKATLALRPFEHLTMMQHLISLCLIINDRRKKEGQPFSSNHQNGDTRKFSERLKKEVEDINANHSSDWWLKEKVKGYQEQFHNCYADVVTFHLFIPQALGFTAFFIAVFPILKIIALWVASIFIWVWGKIILLSEIIPTMSVSFT